MKLYEFLRYEKISVFYRLIRLKLLNAGILFFNKPNHIRFILLILTYAVSDAAIQDSAILIAPVLSIKSEKK